MHASFVKVRVHMSESWELKDKTIMDKILINCSILRHDVNSIFGVRILDSTPVGELKKAIKKEKEPDVTIRAGLCHTSHPSRFCDTFSTHIG